MIRWVQGVILLGTVFLVAPVYAGATTDFTPTPNSSFYFSKAGSPYVIDGVAYIDQNSSVVIEAGVVFKFKTATSSLEIHGAAPITNQATIDEPIYFTSYADDEHGGDTNSNGSATEPLPGDWGNVTFGCGTTFDYDRTRLSYMRVLYGGSEESAIGLPSSVYGQLDYYPASVFVCLKRPGIGISDSLIIDKLVVAHGHAGLLVQATNNYVSVAGSAIYDNELYGLQRAPSWLGSKDVAREVIATGNWWGDISGPYHEDENPSGLGNAIAPSGSLYPMSFDPWLTEDPLPEPESGCILNCNSNILFLPGIMGSRLFSGSEQLWEPGGEQDVQNLYLNSDGTSVDPNVSATEVVDTFDGPLIFNVDIYDAFLGDLEYYKGDLFNDYEAAPYDWRLSIPGAIEKAGIEEKLRNLAASSRSGKVTIIAHSNGGLVAKALVNLLGSDAENLVDKMILVATPQLGTPQAVGALLHGYDSGISFLYSSELAREFAQNAPMAYQLVPHLDYYSNTGASVSTPIISFENGSSTQAFVNAYGPTIDSGSELSQFIVGGDGRAAPSYYDLENPGIGNAALYSQANTLMQDIGSAWQAPVGIEVHQIVGIGEPTLASITYKTKKVCVNNLFGYCLEQEDRLTYTPEETLVGDGTVVVPSALAMSDDADSVHRWWVDLFRYHQNHPLEISPFAKNHKNILEIFELRTFILNNIFTDAETVLPEYLSPNQPIVPDNYFLRFVLHSPLKLSAEDASGNRIGPGIGEIPGATYKRYGEVQVLSVPAAAHPTMHLEGVAEGSFMLEIEEYTNGSQVSSAIFSGIPSATSTSASMKFSNGTIAGASDLLIDYDGDGVIDSKITPEEGEEVTAPDMSVLELIQFLRAYVADLDVDKKLKIQLKKKIDKIQKTLDKNKKSDKKELKKLKKEIREIRKQKDATKVQVKKINNLIKSIKKQLNSYVVDDKALKNLKRIINKLSISKKDKTKLQKQVRDIKDVKKITKAIMKLTQRIIKSERKGDISNADLTLMVQLLDDIEKKI